MKRVRLVGISALALLAFSALTASVAQATEGPFYKICENNAAGKFEDNECSKLGGPKAFEKVRLGAGSSKAIEAEASKQYELIAVGKTIICTAQKLKESTIIGSAAASNLPGTSKEVIVFENCTVKGNGSPCEVAQKKTITTKPVKNTLDYQKATKTGEGLLLVHFQPESGVFVTIEFEGAGCTVLSTAVEGSVGAEAWNSAGLPISVGSNEQLGEIGEVNFPTTAIKTGQIEEGKEKFKETKLSLKVFGLASTLVGRSKIKLATKEHWGIFTN